MRYATLLLAFFFWSCDSGGVIYRDAGQDIMGDDGAELVTQEASDPAWAEAIPETEEVGAVQDSDLADGPEVMISLQPYIPAKSFRIEPAGWDGDSFLVAVVARDFEAIFGVALRVEWDADVLRLEDVTLEPIFGEQDVIYKAAEVRPGSLTMVWSHIGAKKEAKLESDKKMATLKFSVKKLAPTNIGFFVPRCLVLTRRLDKVEAIYIPALVALL